MALLAIDRSAGGIELPCPGGDRVLIAAAKTDRFSEEQYRSFYRLLDEDERKRLQRLRFASNRREYLLAHALTRWVLAACLDDDPRLVHIVRDKFGKPRLAETGSPAFSLSHTTGGVLCAAGYTSCLGADIELVSRPFSLADVLMAYTSSERHWLTAMNEGDLDSMALRWWTVKEAFIKADGRGLGISPAAICCAQDGTVPMGSLGLSKEELLPDRVAVAYRGEVIRAWSDHWMAWVALGETANLQPYYCEWLGGEHWVRLWPDRRWRFRQAFNKNSPVPK